MPSRSERKVWRSLRKRKGRDATGWFLAEGRTLVRDVLAAGHGGEAVLLERDRSDTRDLRDAAARGGWRVEEVERRVIEEVADTKTPQSALAIARIPRWTWDDVGAGPLVLLDGIQDPGNAGTLIRTAIGLGAAGVVVLGDGADPWGPKAFRASAGASLRGPVFSADASSTIAELAHRRIPIWVAEVGGEAVDRGSGGDGRVALALGSEARGVSTPIAGAAVRRVSIGMRAEVESLNVAVAGAILLDRIMNGPRASRAVEDVAQGEEGSPGHGD